MDRTKSPKRAFFPSLYNGEPFAAILIAPDIFLVDLPLPKGAAPYGIPNTR